MNNLFLLFKDSGFNVEREKDIPQNIIWALKILTPHRKKKIEKRYISIPFHDVFKSHAGETGGNVNKDFLKGALIYKSATLRINKGDLI